MSVIFVSFVIRLSTNSFQEKPNEKRNICKCFVSNFIVKPKKYEKKIQLDFISSCYRFGWTYFENQAVVGKK